MPTMFTDATMFIDANHTGHELVIKIYLLGMSSLRQEMTQPTQPTGM